MTTPFHAKYWAHSLRLGRHDGVDAISRSIGNARVDLNPHQVDAALFALRSPYSKGVLLADEVGLGKTIEASLTIEAIAKVVRDPQLAPTPKALQSDEVQKKLVEVVKDKLSGGQLTMYPDIGKLTDAQLVLVVREATAVYNALTIAIPRVIVLPKGVVRAGFRDFSLDLSSFRLQPVSQEILVRHLERRRARHRRAFRGRRRRAARELRRAQPHRLRRRELRRAGRPALQARGRGRHAPALVPQGRRRGPQRPHLSREADRRPRSHADAAAAWEEPSSYEAVVSQGFSDVRAQAFAAPAGEVVRQYDTPIDNKVDIRKMLFGGFKKCLYPTQKFDSDTDTERRFTVVIEKDKAVIKWFKPGKGVFQIRYSNDADYEPDFVVETETEKLICEPKGADRMQDPVVLAKARAAATWCKHATEHEKANQGKPWRYLLIPHDAIADNMTLDGLARQFTFVAPAEGK